MTASRFVTGLASDARWRRLAALLATTLVLARPAVAAERTLALTVQVSTQAGQGPLRPLFRPSVMMSWADDEAIDAFLALPGRLGAVRLTLETALGDSTDLADYRRRLADQIPRMKQLAARGATLVVTVARMPRWLSSRTSEASTGKNGFSEREAAPPKDLDAFANLAFETVRMIKVDQGLDVLYEFWNEPEASIFWGGTQAELFQAYASFSSGARRADPGARVGGLGGSWNEPRSGQPPGSPSLLKAFVDRAAAQRLPLDFISWHNFPKLPVDGWEGAAQIRAWLKANGLSVAMPQVVTEWNRWATFPDWLDPPRDDVDGAAFMVASLFEMDQAGVSLQTMATLQDFNDPPNGSAFPGDFGLMTRKPVLKKASFHAMNMLALLDGQQRLPAVLAPRAQADAQGVDVLAVGGAGGHVGVLLTRHAATTAVAVGGVFARSLHRSGITERSQIGASDAGLLAFARHEGDLRPGDASPAVRQALELARTATEQAGDGAADEVVVTLALTGLAASSRYQIYRIDADHLNPGRAYREARAHGDSHGAALAAARARQSFVPVLSGSGAIPPVALPKFAVVLVWVDAAR